MSDREVLLSILNDFFKEDVVDDAERMLGVKLPDGITTAVKFKFLTKLMLDMLNRADLLEDDVRRIAVKYDVYDIFFMYSIERGLQPNEEKKYVIVVKEAPEKEIEGSIENPDFYGISNMYDLMEKESKIEDYEINVDLDDKVAMIKSTPRIIFLRQMGMQGIAALSEESDVTLDWYLKSKEKLDLGDNLLARYMKVYKRRGMTLYLYAPDNSLLERKREAEAESSPSRLKKVLDVRKKHPKKFWGSMLALLLTIALSVGIPLIVSAIRRASAPNISLNQGVSSLDVPCGTNVSFKPVLEQEGGFLTFGPRSAGGARTIQNLCVDLPQPRTVEIVLDFDIANYSPDKISLSLLELAAIDYCVVSVNGTVVANYPDNQDSTPYFKDVAIGTNIASPFVITNMDGTTKNQSFSTTYGAIYTFAGNGLVIPGLRSNRNEIKFKFAIIGAGNIYFKMKYTAG